MKKKSAARNNSVGTVVPVLIALLASCFRAATVFALARPPVPGLKQQDDPMWPTIIVGWLILIALGAAALKRRTWITRVIGLLVLAALLAVWFEANFVIVG
jgi:hypothetical protein